MSADKALILVTILICGCIIGLMSILKNHRYEIDEIKATLTLQLLNK